MQEDDVAATWKSETFQTGLEEFLVNEQVASLRCMNVHPLSDDEARPTIIIALYDTSDPDWWNVRLVALQEWLQSDEVYLRYKICFAVDLIQYVSCWQISFQSPSCM